MDKLKHWIIVLERIKTELLWSPYENDAANKIRELIKEMVWWYQKSRQFLGKNKTKLNCSRNSWLTFQIHLCWCLIVKRLMQALRVVKREILT